MKIKEIKYKRGTTNTFVVTFIPNWFEKLLGIKEQEDEYKANGNIYTFGDGHVYLKKNGEFLGNHNYIGEAIDKWRRSW